MTIMTTHVGSLIRPAGLRSAMMATLTGERDLDEQARAELKEDVEGVVARQVELGLDVVSDGEFSKLSWIAYFYNRVKGIEARVVRFDPGTILDVVPKSVAGQDPGRDLYRDVFRFVDFWADYASDSEGVGWVCTGPIEYDATAIGRQLSLLRAAADRAGARGAFVTSVAPASLYYLKDEYFGNERDLIFSAAEALRVEYQQILDAGFVLQVDDAVLWHRYATFMLMGKSTREYAEWADLRIEALNYALEGIPLERIRYHVCSGSTHGPKTFDPSLRDIYPFVAKVRWGALLFEQANVGHEHEWEMWRDVDLAEDRILIPGVVTHHTPMVEHRELVAQRLVRLAGIVGVDRVAAGTDCGFAQSANVSRVDEWTQWAKLRALVEGAELANERLSAP